MKSKRKKNRDIQKIKSSLGVSRKKNYTKERNVDIKAPINESIESESFSILLCEHPSIEVLLKDG